jgi:crotonobetainyl-CoA:carnitine CoA-transferase CaiB-like acyl-CoA transferase
MLRSTDEWLAEPHARASGTFVDVVDPGFGNVRVPGPAIRVHGVTSDSVPQRLDPTDRDDTIVEQIDRVLVDQGTGDREASRDDERRSSAPPLHGITVLDLSRVVAAPTAAKLLGQLGADVIKLDEDPKFAQCATPVPAFHEHLNRAKRSIVLDLKTDADAAVFRSLVDQADVVVENFTIGVADRLGASFDALHEHAPSVVVLSLNAYGRTGPWAPHRGYAELANFSTGVTERTAGGVSPESGDELTDLPRWTYTDYLAGVLGAFGVVTALYDRLHSGTGRLVETSLARATTLEQILSIVAQLDDEHRVQGRIDADREPRGRGPKGWSARQSIYETTDGAIYLGAHADQLDGLLHELQIESAVSDAELHAQLTDAFATRRTDDALELLDHGDVGAHRVTSVGEIMSAGDVADQRGLRLEDHSPNLGAVVMPGPVVRFSRTPMRPGGLPPPFGEDHDEIVALAVEGTWR